MNTTKFISFAIVASLAIQVAAGGVALARGNDNNERASHARDLARRDNPKAKRDRVKNPTACRQLQKNLEKRLGNIAERTSRHIGVIEKVAANAMGYASEQQISLSEAQIKNIADARQVADKSLAEFKAAEKAYSCNSTEFGTVSSNLRHNVATLRESVKEYRLAVKDALDSIKATESANINAEGSN